MTDRLTKEQRHRCMSKIHSRNTKPELKVRRWLWSHGYRYRLCVKSVPGSPDIVMRPYRTAIFVNGCFWHGHNVELKIENGKLKCRDAEPVSDAVPETSQIIDSPCCKIPKSNRGFWVEKIRRNQQRDERNYQILRDNGWQVIVVWECELKPTRIEHTMRAVELRLNQCFLDIHSRKVRAYAPDTPDAMPLAAEDTADYGKNNEL
ncbi:MAG: very short patch repair endonuclease [Bacteroidales bacterium]|nr:very short patch repair endonuclease [Bacteroidales bacterium]